MSNNEQSIKDDFSKIPKLNDIGRYYVTEFVKNVAAKLPEGSIVLDAGAGECAYKRYFSHCRYLSVDLAVGDDEWNYQHLDYIAPLDDMPIADNEFDAVLLTQVLEHLSRPQQSVNELFRVLKRGGVLYLTAPMAQAEHQVPYDFFRYTSYGLRHLLTEAGFSDIDIKPMGGVFVRWAYEMPTIIALFPRIGYTTNNISMKGIFFTPLRLVVTMIVLLTQYIFLFLDRYDKTGKDTWGWRVTAMK
jgi:SAM-dependent methyltransferase